MTAKLDHVYAAMVAAGVPTDNHESDLYALDCPEARAVLASFPGVTHTTFVSAVDGKRWIDVPFMFEPWWAARTRATDAQVKP